MSLTFSSKHDGSPCTCKTCESVWFAYLFPVLEPHVPAVGEVLKQVPALVHFTHVYESVRTEFEAADEREEAELEEDEPGHRQKPLAAHDLREITKRQTYPTSFGCLFPHEVNKCLKCTLKTSP